MSGKPGLSGGMMAGAAAATVAVAGGIGWLVWGAAPVPQAPLAAVGPAVPASPVATPGPAAARTAVATPEPASEPAPPAATAPVIEAPAAAPQAPAPEATAEPASPDPLRPAFDTFRHGRDGSAVVAGSAGGADVVAVLVDGAEVARATVDRSGRFAALFTLPPLPQARAMVLRAYQPDGSSIDSDESLMIAPLLVDPAPAADPAPPPPIASAVPPAADLPVAPTPAPVAAAEAPPAAPEAAPVTPALAPVAAPSAVVIATPEPLAPAVQRPAAAVTAAAAPETAAVPVPPAPRPDPVPAPLQPANLLVSDGGVTVLRPAPEQRMVIDSISYSAAGAVQVAGKGGAGALVRLYLDNVAQFDTLADDLGAWAGTLPPVTPGLYTLRADQLDPAGSKVMARSETPFLREPPEALAAISTRSTPVGAPAAEVVTVQPGYTLWGIARQTYGEGVLYVKVFEANRDQIRNPDLIYPGQVFALPQAE